MACSVTHSYFSLDLYDRLSIRSKELLMHEKNSLKLFAQGNDILTFYGKRHRIVNFSIFARNNKVYDFFQTLINYIKYNNHQYNPQVISFLYGMISHYVLETTINPYIIYKTGIFNKENPNTYKYNMLHEKLETYFDNYLVMLNGNIPCYKFKCYDFCFNDVDLDKDLIEVMDFTYKEVFGITEFHNYYYKAIKNAKKYYKKYRYDPSGIKRFMYLLHDIFSTKKTKKKRMLSYRNKPLIRRELFNLDHKVWYNPTDKRTKSYESILELYTKALGKSGNIIQEINKYLYYDKKINLKRLIGNLNYDTGKDCSKKKELKYFEF